MIRVLHGQTATLSLGFVLAYLFVVVGGSVVFFPAVTLALRFFTDDPLMSLLTLFSASGWLACVIWLTGMMRIRPSH